jgi:hypothetical protein
VQLQVVPPLRCSAYLFASGQPTQQRHFRQQHLQQSTTQLCAPQQRSTRTMQCRKSPLSFSNKLPGGPTMRVSHTCSHLADSLDVVGCHPNAHLAASPHLLVTSLAGSVQIPHEHPVTCIVAAEEQAKLPKVLRGHGGNLQTSMHRDTRQQTACTVLLSANPQSTACKQLHSPSCQQNLRVRWRPAQPVHRTCLQPSMRKC